MSRSLSNPIVQVNDTTIAVKPNSFKYNSGKGEKTVRAQSAGGNSVEAFLTEDAETKLAMVTFTLYTTQDNIGLVEQWQDNLEGNTLTVSEGSFQKNFTSMYVINDPDINFSADGEIEIEFKGNPTQ